MYIHLHGAICNITPALFNPLICHSSRNVVASCHWVQTSHMKNVIVCGNLSSSLSPPTFSSHCKSHLTALKCAWIGTAALCCTVALLHIYRSSHLHGLRWSMCGGSLVFTDHESDSSSCKRVKPWYADWLRIAFTGTHTHKCTNVHTCTPSEIYPRLFRASISHST